jgi:hypothetical protein
MTVGATPVFWPASDDIKKKNGSKNQNARFNEARKRACAQTKKPRSGDKG